jgi:hypothetical protein
MARNTILALIDALAQEEAGLRGQEFLAPLTRDGRARLRVRGLIHELALRAPRAGWWRCRALDTARAEVVEEALPWQRGDYLALWPALRLVLVAPLRASGEAWLALPFNPSDAAQRFGDGGPRVVQLVEQGRPFERVVGRVEGATVWYDEPDRRGDPLVAEALRAAWAGGSRRPEVAGLGAGEAAAYALLARQAEQQLVQEQQARDERRLREALELGGACLVDFMSTQDGLRVSWERDGLRGVTLVGTDLDVISAGICLSGQDQRFDLTSIVGVVGEAPDYARFDGHYT